MELANGRYPAIAVEWALGETSAGKEQVAVLFALSGEGVNGQTITWYGYFTDKTMESTIKALRACGWKGSDLSDLQGLSANEVQLVIENEADDKGVTRPKVRWVNVPGTGGLALKAPLQADKAKAFAARMKGSILALEQGKPPVAQKPSSAPAGHPVDADIPF